MRTVCFLFRPFRMLFCSLYTTFDKICAFWWRIFEPMGGQAGDIDVTLLLTDPNYFRFQADAVTGLTSGGLRNHSSLFLQKKKPQQKLQNRNLFIMSNNNVVLCYLMEQQNCGAKSTGPELISDLRAGRSVFQWQPWSYHWRQQTSMTVRVLV